MSHLFTCPHCQTRTEVEDRYSGLKGQCVACRGEIQLPNFTGHSPALPGSLASASAISPSTPDANSKAAARSINPALAWLAGGLVALMLVGTLLFSVVRFGGQTISTLASTREQTASFRNLEKIAAALNAYAADQGSYPPARTVDANQVPLHSWRVLILPYLGEDDLYDRFDLALPWDHPVNQAAASFRVPTVYQHPSGNQFGGNGMGVYNEAAYYLITGPGTLFPRGGSLRPADITDDLSKTILVTEASPQVGSTMWIEPVDLDVTLMQGRLDNNQGNEPGGLVEGGVCFATADGRGHFVPDTIEPSIVKALVTPQGGERMSDDVLD